MTGLLGLVILLAPVSLDQAIEQGLSAHPELAASGARIDGARARLDEVEAHAGAKVFVEGGAMAWAEEQTLTLGGGGGGGGPALPPPSTPYEAATGQLVDSLSSLSGLTVREHFTTDLKVKLVQPLTGLLHLKAAAAASSAGLHANRVERAVVERVIVQKVIEAYLRVLQSQAMIASAEASVEQIRAVGTRTDALIEAGLVNRVDGLRLDVAEADARQRLAATQAMNWHARLALGLAMGLGEPVDVIDQLPEWLAAAPQDRQASVESALNRRPELKMLDARAEQAGHAVAMARSDYLPQVSAIAHYQHTTGSELQPENALFAGLVMQWTPFEWGATRARVGAAEADRRAVVSTRSGLEQRIAFETERAWSALRTANDVIAVAEQAVAQAEEATRLEQARFEAQEATATELLAAEAAQTNARTNLANARFNRLIALNALRHASGMPLRGEP